MLARLADSYYWMTRYLERIENYARFMDVNFNLTLDFSKIAREQWAPQIAVSGDDDIFRQYYSEYSKENVLYFLSFDARNPNSIWNSVLGLLENAKYAKPELPVEIWEQMNFLKQEIVNGMTDEMHKQSNPSSFFRKVKNCCYMISGAIEGMLYRSEAYHFAMMGKFIERADKTIRVLDVKYHILLPEDKGIGTSFDLLHWAALLKSVSAYEIYIKKYGVITPDNIVNFIIFDNEFPRALIFNIECLEQSASKLSGNIDGVYNDVEKQIINLKRHLLSMNTETMILNGLHEILTGFLNEISRLSDLITNYYFVNKRYLNVAHIRPFEEKNRIFQEQTQRQSLA